MDTKDRDDTRGLLLPAMPAFIIGQHRSGTTMLRNLFRAHPRIAATPELYIFERIWGRRALSANRKLVRYAAGELGLSDDVTERIASTPSWSEHLRLLGEHTAQTSDYDLLVIKTPLNVYFTDWLRHHFPASPVIFIMRDGREICASAVKKWKHQGTLPLSIAARWALTVTEYEKRLQKRPHYLIYYEDITADPDSAFRALFEYLGMEYDPAYAAELRGTSSFGDKTDARGIYRSTHASTFFEEGARRRLEGLLRPYLLKHGYALEFSEHAVPLKLRVAFALHYYKHALYFFLTRLGLRDAWRLVRQKRTP